MLHRKNQSEYELHVIIAGGVSILLGTLAIAGWISGNNILASLYPEYLPMPAPAALSAIGFGFILLSWTNMEHNKILKSLNLGVLFILSFYSLLKTSELLFKTGFSVDNYLFTDHTLTNNLGSLIPLNRISPLASLLFLLSGFSILLSSLNSQSKSIINLAGSLGIIVSFTGFATTLGYIRGEPFLYGSGTIPLSLPSSLVMFFLGAGLVFLAGERSIFLHYVSGNSSSAKLLRGIIPLTILAILLDRILEAVLSRFIPINIPILVSLVTIFLMAVTVILAIRIARLIFRDAEIAEKERQMAEDALKESEKKYRLIIENQGEGIGLVDTEERFIFANPAAERIFGVDPGTLMNRNLMEFLKPESVDEVLRETQKRSQSEQSSYEIEIVTPGEEHRVLLVTASPQFDDNATFTGTFGVFRDLSERKKIEESLKQSEERFRKLAETAADGIISIDSEGIIRLFNQSAGKIFGYDPTEVIGNKVELFIPEEYGDLHMKGIFRYLETGNAKVLGKTVELTAKRRNGIIFPIELSLSEVKVGEESNFIGMIRDISERKIAESRLAEFNEELKELNATKDKFFSIIAHDLRNPFNLLLGYSNILAEEIENKNFGEAQALSSRIYSVSKSTYSLLENLLTWSQVQTRNISFRKESFNLDEILAPELKLMTAMAEQKSILLVNQINNLAELNADINMIITVIRNLVNNAIKFTMQGGVVTLSSETGDNGITIHVSDTGIGMSKEEVNKLFDVSKAVSKPGTAREKGTGLGLILCKEFVTLHGGNIHVESEPGHGSRFSFTIPV